jgi:RNA polymerase sigma-70 factor, ECF subfamily
MDNRKNLDHELVAAAQQGDMQAFDRLVRRYKSRLINYLSWTMCGPHEVEDVVQETLLRAYKGLRRFRGESLFSTWLFRIGINTAKRSLARNARNHPFADYAGKCTSDDWQMACVDYDSPDVIMESRQLLADIDDVLDHLQPELRVAFMLRNVDGLGYDEIALAMLTPIGTVRSRIYRAREAVAIRLREHDDAGYSDPSKSYARNKYSAH